jgi:hypothetical protein
MYGGKMIWEYSSANGFGMIEFVDPSEKVMENRQINASEINKCIHAAPQSNLWKPIWCQLMFIDPEYLPEIREKRNILVDFVGNTGLLPIFSERAINVLKPLLQDTTEILPLRWYPDESIKLYLINVLNIIDCLDRDASDLLYSEESGKLLFAERIVLHKDFAQTHHIFKDQTLGRGHIFISNEFKQTVEENKLIGLVPRPVKLT